MSDALQRGIAAHRAGDLRTAEALYASHLDLSPEDADALYMLGVLFLQTDRTQQAHDLLSKAVRNQPSHGRALYSLGRACSLLGRGADAAAHYAASLASGLRQADTYLELSVELLTLGRLEEAERVARDGVAAFPRDAAILHSLAQIRVASDAADEAIDLFETAARLSNDQPLFLFNWGVCLLGAGRNAEAVTVFRKLVDKAPTMWRAHGRLGLALLGDGQFDAAMAAYREATRLRRCPETPGDPWGDKTRSRTRPYKLRHDIEQFRYLASRGIEVEKFDPLARDYEALLGVLDAAGRDDRSVPLPEAFRASHWDRYNCALRVAGGAVPPGGAINRALDAREIEREYHANTPNHVVVDELLSAEAWRALYDFSLESTVWYDFEHEGYVAAMLEDGLMPPVLLDLARRLPEALPAIFGDHKLLMVWAYKYDNAMKAVGPHADFAAVNVNLWLTPTEASTDPSRAGLRLYTVGAPLDWGFKDYNSKADRIRAYLAEHRSGVIDIGFRANRATIFDSNLFHESGELNFRDGYENRRINITLLYGKREAVARPVAPG